MSSIARKQNNKNKLYLLSCLSGILLSLSFPKVDLFYLAWFVMVPFLYGLSSCTNKEAFKSGIFFGIPFFFGTQYWIYHSINHYGNLNFTISIFIVILLCIYEALYTGLFALIVNHFLMRSHFPLVIIGPILWVCIEFARGYIFTGFPWSFIGYSQYKLIPLLQIADMTGVYGVSFLVIAVNGFLADFLILNKRRREIPLYPAISTYFGAFLLIGLFIFSLSYGYYKLSKEFPENTLKVSIVQGNIDQNKKWDIDYQSSVFTTYISLSQEAVSEKPDLIVWPETSVPFLFGTNKNYTVSLLEFQKEHTVPLLFGSIMVKSIENNKYRLTNSAVLIDSHGKIAYIYDKIHLVPFGEYVPLKSVLFFINRLVEGVGDYIPGEEYAVAEEPYGRFATVICYELTFPSLVRKFFTKGGDFLVTITNDAWFGDTSGPHQHFQTGIFRAIENRKPLVRAANSGISGFIDSRGRVVRTSNLFEEAILTVSIQKDASITFYTKYGDVFVYLCLLSIVIILINSLFHSRRHFGGKKW